MSLAGIQPISWFSAIWATVILILSVVPGEDLPSISIWEADKLAHAFVYAVLSISVILTLNKQFSWTENRWKVIIFALVLCNLYGTCIECIQGFFLPSRTFDVFDLAANFIGCMLGGTVRLFIFKPH